MALILGIDEVGRGAWAGPLVVGAVVLDDVSIQGLADSKQLTAKQRHKLALEIKGRASDIGLGWVGSRAIDEIGLAAALKLAARRAVTQITTDYSEIIIDGTIKLIDDPRVVTLKKADQLISAVSAASIMAKTVRDTYMARLDQAFPDYYFADHVGYGTTKHRRALVEHGVLPIHRTSFAPVAEVLGNKPHAKVGKIENTTGRIAENIAAEYLVRAGHTIIDRNWRTKFCEIDIISKRDDIIYFTEVKYRRNARAGDGLAAITSAKLKQMKFAAEIWAQKYQPNCDLRLAAISMTGNPPEVNEFLENVH